MNHEQVRERVRQAVKKGKLSSSAAKNIEAWLTEPRYAAYVDQVSRHVEQQDWKLLDDVFWTVIPFGTGGRRGRMFPIGSNAINERTIGESAQGLATYVKQHAASGVPLSCAIAYDTRHNSRAFAELCAEIMVASGFHVCFLDDYRSTPELSFLVRFKNCSCGIMVTASHNPPSDNAVKCYWSTGGQLLPPHDKGVIDEVMRVGELARVTFAEAVRDGRVEICTAEVDQAFIEAVAAQAFPGPRELNVVYSPLHGVGSSAVLPALRADGFRDVRLFAPHAEPNGDFPNVPNHVANPENKAVFDDVIAQAQQDRVDLIIATDPDCDRLGCAAPLAASDGAWRTFSGNQIAALLADYVLEQRKLAGTLSPQHYVVKTLVTTELVRRIAESYGVRTIGDLLVGFKWIGGIIDQEGPDKFVFGAEESHGYLVGQYARDKDAAVASMLLAELAACVKSSRKSLNEKLDSLYWQHGYHAEHLINQTMTGSEGMTRMQNLMSTLRASPPRQLAGLDVAVVRDYQNGVRRLANGTTQPLEGPQGDLVMLDLECRGNYVAVRPSGTEPKVKYYLFTFVPAEQIADLEVVKAEMQQRIANLERDLCAFAESV